MHHLSIDIETYSSEDIKKVGLYKYAESPDFEILLFAYSFDGSPVEIVDLANGEEIPDGIKLALFHENVIKHAYNAAFEWYCLSKYFGINNCTDWLYQWQCTMLHGLYCGYTAGLGATGDALGLSEDKKKLAMGKSLIKLFCNPTKPTAKNGRRTRTLPHHEPEKWELFKEYCIQDVVTEMEIGRKLSAFPVPEKEQKLWALDQIINSTGIRLDRDFIASAIYVDSVITDELFEEAKELTGLENPNSVKQLTEWLQSEYQIEVPGLKKATVIELLEQDIDDKAKRVLEIRQELSKTSIKKYEAMENCICEDNRARGLLQFYGANRTGRWAGRLIQVQNLPRNNLDTLDIARKLVKQKNIDALKLIYGKVSEVLSQLIRTAFIPADEHVFVVADFSAIEARIVAWLAGETWRQEVFATHGKIYEASAAAMFGVPIEKIVKGNPEYELRQKGKIAELALGYQGSVVALKNMGALNMGLTEEELPDIVQRWRQANPRIVELWYELERAALNAIQNGYATCTHSLMFAREGDYSTGQDFLTITLPSGRKLYYARPFVTTNQRGFGIYYWGTGSSKKWDVIDIYGGKFTENVVQAIARDCLAESMLRLHAAGFRIVMHVHDEVVIEVPVETAEQDIKTICEIMSKPIEWAPGLLLKADGYICEYYKKE